MQCTAVSTSFHRQLVADKTQCNTSITHVAKGQQPRRYWPRHGPRGTIYSFKQANPPYKTTRER